MTNDDIADARHEALEINERLQRVDAALVTQLSKSIAINAGLRARIRALDEAALRIIAGYEQCICNLTRAALDERK